MFSPAQTVMSARPLIAGVRRTPGDSDDAIREQQEAQPKEAERQWKRDREEPKTSCVRRALDGVVVPHQRTVLVVFLEETDYPGPEDRDDDPNREPGDPDGREERS
jgi:hypothetical protein